MSLQGVTLLAKNTPPPLVWLSSHPSAWDEPLPVRQAFSNTHFNRVHVSCSLHSTYHNPLLSCYWPVSLFIVWFWLLVIRLFQGQDRVFLLQNMYYRYSISFLLRKTPPSSSSLRSEDRDQQARTSRCTFPPANSPICALSLLVRPLSFSYWLPFKALVLTLWVSGSPSGLGKMQGAGLSSRSSLRVRRSGCSGLGSGSVPGGCQCCWHWQLLLQARSSTWCLDFCFPFDFSPGLFVYC